VAPLGSEAETLAVPKRLVARRTVQPTFELVYIALYIANSSDESSNFRFLF